MKKGDFLRELDEEVGRLYSEYQHSNMGDAFAHWSVIQIGGLDEDSAFVACSISGGHDKGIDASWSDDESGIFHILQAKYGKGLVRSRRECVQTLVAAAKWLKDVDACYKVSRELGQVAETFVKAIRENLEIVFHLVIKGKITDATEQEKRVLAPGLPPQAKLELWGVDRLQKLYEEQFETVRLKKTLRFPIVDDEYFEHGAPPPKAIVATIRAEDFAEVVRPHEPMIYDLNVRYHLGRNKVNEGIESTLTSAERAYLWHYNNGISIVCKSCDLVKEKNKSSEVRVMLEVVNPQIVNGCQTTRTLVQHIDSIRDTAAMLLIRFIASTDDDLSLNITRYTNTQNPTRASDFRANDTCQLKIKHDFEKLNPPYFYERKRGERKSLSKAERKRFGSGQKFRIVEMAKLAPRFYAFIGHPAASVRETQKLFYEEARYKEIFEQGHSAEEYLVPYVLFDQLRERYKQEMSQWKKTNNDPKLQKLESQDHERHLLFRALRFQIVTAHILALLNVFLKEEFGTYDHTVAQNLLKPTLSGRICNEMYNDAVEPIRRFLASNNVQEIQTAFKADDTFEKIKSEALRDLRRIKEKGGTMFPNLQKLVTSV